MVVTEKRRATSRENGKKGKGPKTEAGKNRSKMNAIKHGFTCEFILLPGESHVEFERLKRQYLNRFQPRDACEYTAVEEMVQCDWELHRAWLDQRCATFVRIDDQRERVDREFIGASPDFRMALARKAEFTEDHAYAQILERHITRITLRMARAQRRLEHLRKQFPIQPAPPSEPASAPAENPQTQNLQNEPEKASTPVAPPIYRPGVIPFPDVPRSFGPSCGPAPQPPSRYTPSPTPGDPPCD